MSSAEKKLRKVLGFIVEENFPQALDVKIKPIKGTGSNYTSSLFDVTVITPEGHVELFAKVVNMGDIEITDYMVQTEHFIYSTLSVAYENLQNKHGVSDQRFIFPKCYMSNKVVGPHVVIMDNLVSKGYDVHDRFKNIDWEYGSECVKSLAKYHALSFALRKECPEEFKKAQKALKGPPQSSTADWDWNNLTDGAMAAVDKENREKLSRLLEGAVGWSKMMELYAPRNTSVIIHADYRPSNLMHKKENGSLHVLPVDYQNARLGCPAADLVNFIMMATDRQFRRQHYHQLVDHYYQQLAQALKTLGMVLEEEYGREEFESDMKEKLPIGISVAAIALPFVTVDAAQAPRFALGEFVPRANERFAERFRALMEDFKQWGFI